MTSTTDPVRGTTAAAGGDPTGPDPRGARWAYVSGAAGMAANALLVGFFAAMPTAGRENLLGPANDIVGSVATACMIPAAIAVGRHLPPSGPLRVLQLATLGALGVATAAGPLLVTGVLSFPVSAAASTGAYAVMVTWIGFGSRWLGNHKGLAKRTARLGQVSAWVSLAGGAAAAASLVASGPLRVGLLGTALAAGATAWLAVPVWWLVVGRWLDQPHQPVAPTR